jgi:hypothetical protein
MTQSGTKFLRNLGNTVMFSFMAGFMLEKYKDRLPMIQTQLPPSSNSSAPSLSATQQPSGKTYTKISFVFH